MDVVPPGRWRLPVTGRAWVVGPLHTLALGANVGVSRAMASLVRVEGSVGYLTSGNDSVFGTARLHALSAEGVLDVQLLALNPHSEIAVGGNASVYGAHVTAFSAWGYDEPSAQGLFAMWGLHASLATTLSSNLRTALRVGFAKDFIGLRVKAGGQQLMSLYGFGADLRLGVAYAW